MKQKNLDILAIVIKNRLQAEVYEGYEAVKWLAEDIADEFCDSYYAQKEFLNACGLNIVGSWCGRKRTS